MFNAPQDDAQDHNGPAHCAGRSNTILDTGLDPHERDCSPKHNLKAVEDGVGFETCVSMESADVLGQQLISDHDE